MPESIAQYHWDGIERVTDGRKQAVLDAVRGHSRFQQGKIVDWGDVVFEAIEAYMNYKPKE